MNFNNQAYELMRKLSHGEVEQTNAEPLTGSHAERESIDLSNKISKSELRISKAIDYADRTVSIFRIVNDFAVGFDKKEYPLFQELVFGIQTEYYEDLASKEFIEDKAFEWFLYLYDNKRAIVDILPYIDDHVKASLKEYTFYFPIDNMRIETPFSLGNTRFVYFTKDEMNEYYDLLKSRENSNTTEENFNTLYRSKFQGIVLAQVTVCSERDHAENIAKENAGLSVDILKFHTNNLTIPDFKVPFDLNFRLNYQRQSVFLAGKDLKDKNLNYNVRFNTSDYSWTDERLTFAYQESMGLFSDFIKLRKKDELYKLIIQAIKAFALALSNWDLHERSISLITIAESLLLKYEEMYKMEQKVKQRISKIGSINDQEDLEIKEYLSNIYQVRHKMVHKAIRLNIVHMDLGRTQTLILLLLMKYIHLNGQFTNKEDVIDHIDSVERV